MGAKCEFIWRMCQWLFNSPPNPQPTKSWAERKPKASSVWSDWSALPHLPLPGIWCSLSVDVIWEPGCLWLLQVQRSGYTGHFMKQLRLWKTLKPPPAHHSHVNSKFLNTSFEFRLPSWLIAFSSVRKDRNRKEKTPFRPELRFSMWWR